MKTAPVFRLLPRRLLTAGLIENDPDRRDNPQLLPAVLSGELPARNIRPEATTAELPENSFPLMDMEELLVLVRQPRQAPWL